MHVENHFRIHLPLPLFSEVMSNIMHMAHIKSRSSRKRKSLIDGSFLNIFASARFDLSGKLFY